MIASKKRLLCPIDWAVAAPPATDQLDTPPMIAVMVEQFNRNEMPFEFENVIALKLLLVVPAETFTACEAVMVEAFRPNVTPLLFAKVTAERLFDVVPALRLI